MAVATLRRELARMTADLSRANPRPTPTLLKIQEDPAATLALAGYPPDPWQAQVLRANPYRTLLLCSRQVGKSETASALALHTALTVPGALVLLLAPGLRQSCELHRKVKDLYNRLGRPVPSINPKDSAMRLELCNGSRIEALPGTEATIRAFSAVRLLVVDEAARVPDSLMAGIRPMLAVSSGSLIALSSAWAKQGWFYESWSGTSGEWFKVRIPATECKRISPEFLREERAALGERAFAMEYMCEFGDPVSALFTEADVKAAMTNDLQPLFGVPA